MAGEKTEKPTAKKLRDARKKGQADAHTPEIGSWLAVLVGSYMIPLVIERGVSHGRKLLADSIATIADPDVRRCSALLRSAADAIVNISLPLFISTIGIALLAHAAQGGTRPTPSLLKPQFKRLNPFQGIKRMVGPQAAWELTKVLAKTALLGVVVWNAVHGILPMLAVGGRLPLSVTVGAVTHTFLTLLRNASAAGLLLAFADYAVAKRRTNKGLRMSKQDIKDEYKSSEGDPQVRAQIRSRQMAMSRNRMMSDIVKADVIVVNPVHVAVALKYEPARGAPRVLAKGAGVLARRIREEADKHRIPMVENVALARSLYKACEIGQEIPAEMYAAVAQVLAFVMALKARGGAAGFHRPSQFAASDT